MPGNAPLRIELLRVRDVPLLLPPDVTERHGVRGRRSRRSWRRWLLGVPPLAVMFYLLLAP